MAIEELNPKQQFSLLISRYEIVEELETCDEQLLI